MALHTQTNLKLECKRVDLDMQQLRKTRDEEKQKLKVEQEVSIVFLIILTFLLTFSSNAEASEYCGRVQGSEERTESTESIPKQTKEQIAYYTSVGIALRMRICSNV